MRMREYLLLASTLFSLSSAHSNENSPAPTERSPLLLGQGEQRLLEIPGLIKYSLGSDAIRVLSLPKNFGSHYKNTQECLLLKGIHPGIGDLWIWKKDGISEHRLIRVEKTVKEGIPTALEIALGRLQEVEVLFFGKGVVLRGEIQTFAESARIAAIIRGFPNEARDETSLCPKLLEQGKSRLEAWLNNTGLSEKLKILTQGQRIWVRGFLPRPSERRSAEARLHSLFPLAEIELESLPDSAPTVHFRVFLLEIKRNRFRSLGLTWPEGQPNAFRVTPFASSLFHESVQLDVALQTLEGEGSAKVLSNPELVVRAPGEAELFAGGELPIRTQSRYSSNVVWKPYGLTLKLKVTQTDGDRVRLDIMTEVSHLDSSVTADQLPSIQANRMKTQVDASFGTPLLLSGLLQQGMHEQARGLPLLRQIPILGALFGSEDYLNDRSELVAILLPSLRPPSPPMERFEEKAPNEKKIEAAPFYPRTSFKRIHILPGIQG